MKFTPSYKRGRVRPSIDINMGFDDLLKKGQEALAGKDGKIDYKEYSKDAQEAYKDYSSTEGDFQTKAKAAYDGYQEDHKKDAKKEEKK